MARAFIALLVAATMLGASFGASFTGLSRASDPPHNPPHDPPHDRPHDRPHELPGLHNVVPYTGSGSEAFYSGSAPEGDAGFDALVKLGVKTVISVDGATPDLARAKARGLRIVHLPIGYDGFDDARKAELVRAVRDLPKPIYLHCHHGKHRSAAAAGAVAVSLRWMTNEAAAARMKVSGTAVGYRGLWLCVAKASPMDGATIDAACGDFPEQTKPESLVASMVAIDEALDSIQLAVAATDSAKRGASAADAAKIADLLRILEKDESVERMAKSVDFRALLRASSTRAGALEKLLGEGSSAGVPDAVARLRESCKDCHAKHRD
jgi:protein tyrosine phosphatase (PTP) superfamily phosphohydrolase (DUF442 family)